MGRTDRRLFVLAVWVSLTLATVSFVDAAAAADRKQPYALPREPIRVGPGRAISTIGEAAQRVVDGDTVEVDAGEYRGDTAVWLNDNLTLRAVGGRVRLVAMGMAAEGKAIWVVRGGKVSVAGFDFTGAKVPSHNGAGIRLDKGYLVVRDCSFTDNEEGILTSNDRSAVLEIRDSEFANNGYGDGYTHDIYVGAIAHLTITGSYLHHARSGHLLKSRAAISHVKYNRLTDEIGGTASYELEFPNGGIAYVIGNIIQKDSQAQNPHLISFGAEGYMRPPNRLYLINNTLVDKRPQGSIFLGVRPGADSVLAVNNVLVGRGNLDSAGPGIYKNNFTVGWSEFEFAAREDYRLKATSRLIGKAIDPGTADSEDLRPHREYVHPRSTAALQQPARNPGAVQRSAVASN